MPPLPSPPPSPLSTTLISPSSVLIWCPRSKRGDDDGEAPSSSPLSPLPEMSAFIFLILSFSKSLCCASTIIWRFRSHISSSSSSISCCFCRSFSCFSKASSSICFISRACSSSACWSSRMRLFSISFFSFASSSSSKRSASCCFSMASCRSSCLAFRFANNSCSISSSSCCCFNCSSLINSFLRRRRSSRFASSSSWNLISSSSSAFSSARRCSSRCWRLASNSFCLSLCSFASRSSSPFNSARRCSSRCLRLASNFSSLSLSSLKSRSSSFFSSSEASTSSSK